MLAKSRSASFSPRLIGLGGVSEGVGEMQEVPQVPALLEKQLAITQDQVTDVLVCTLVSALI